MALLAKLHLRQSQSLVITPQLMQAIRLLQMSGQDLDRFLEAEVEQNPLLERVEAPADDPGPPAASLDCADRDEASDWTSAGPEGRELPRLVAERPLPSGGQSSGAGFSDLPNNPGDLAPAAQESLLASLERQIAAGFPVPAERGVALSLLAGLDPAGYLSLDLAGLAARLAVGLPLVEAVLKRCQAFEPAGIFARSLAECLALQLAERNRLDPAMAKLLDNLELLAARNFSALAARCGVDMEDLSEMVAEVRALDPKPGLSRSAEPIRPVIPDVFVRASTDGGWRVELNDAALPKLLVDRTYYAEVAPRVQGAEERRFLQDCIQKASWLEKSLDQRAKTILKVATEIVRQQEDFLRHGVSRLRPLNLRSIADAIGMHESTVSRATSNKYLATPRGIFEFKYFFSSAIQATTGGDAHSAEAVKHRIRTLIGNERPDAVLSDDAIVDLLGSDGIEIARRTVAKYREMMRIGSSVDRRRRNKLAAAPERAGRAALRPSM